MTTPNIRAALELLVKTDNGCSAEWADAIAAARAALAEPEPPDDGEVAIPCNAEIASAMVMLGESFLRQYAPERLAPQPVPEGPSDAELLAEAAESLGYERIPLDHEGGAAEAYACELLAYARAVLVRWGRQPAPDASVPCPPGG